MLTRIVVTINFTGDGVDSDSTLQIEVQRPQDHIIGDYHLANTHVGDRDALVKDLNIRDNTLTPAQIKNTVLYLQIDEPNGGHDRCYGDPSASFTFDDGQILSVRYKSFRIANYDGESNNTHQPVID